MAINDSDLNVCKRCGDPITYLQEWCTNCELILRWVKEITCDCGTIYLISDPEFVENIGYRKGIFFNKMETFKQLVYKNCKCPSCGKYTSY